MKNVIIKSFGGFNDHRYGTPWVCTMDADGTHNFTAKVGTYTGDGRRGEAGDLIVFDPVPGVVYGYGQKDYRKNHGERGYALWDGSQFVPCDKLGREKETT